MRVELGKGVSTSCEWKQRPGDLWRDLVSAGRQATCRAVFGTWGSFPDDARASHCLNFTILYWFCHISTWIHHRYTHVPHPEPSSLLPPRTIPLGRPNAPAPSIQYCALNLDWQLVSYMILYKFQCHSPKSSHPLLSNRVHKTVLYISVSFAVSHTGLLLPSF